MCENCNDNPLSIMKKILRILLSVAIPAIMSTACSCSDASSAPEQRLRRIAPEVAEAAQAEADTIAMLAGDEQALSDRLLSLRATIYNIGLKHGDRVAEDFESVFTDRLRNLNDSLANVLF